MWRSLAAALLLAGCTAAQVAPEPGVRAELYGEHVEVTGYNAAVCPPPTGCVAYARGGGDHRFHVYGGRGEAVILNLSANWTASSPDLEQLTLAVSVLKVDGYETLETWEATSPFEARFEALAGFDHAVWWSHEAPAVVDFDVTMRVTGPLTTNTD